MTAFGLGGALIPMYAALNMAYFGGSLPVSALAKHLTTGLQLSLPVAHMMYAYIRFVAFGTYLSGTYDRGALGRRGHSVAEAPQR
jgi:hypothetical protein